MVIGSGKYLGEKEVEYAPWALEGSPTCCVRETGGAPKTVPDISRARGAEKCGRGKRRSKTGG